ncbi:MAG TPA: 3-dehydroquinate synthase [Candidatus Omnitrophica bacterium]|nr:3-dehydroquinate synthase [Candidatus Omnitrophota bacterium]
MRVVKVNLKQDPYPVYIGENILPAFGELLRKIDFPGYLAVITHPGLKELYGETIETSLKRNGFSYFTIQVPEGENTKSLHQVEALYQDLISLKMGRDSGLVAFGGGVTGDLTGFVAATYLRGISYVQVPTTLLAQVDSSIGGKVGVDLPAGKNLVGAFWQPRMVLSEVSVLRSLPRRELMSGIAEIIKYGIIADDRFFERLDKNMARLLPPLDGKLPDFEFLEEVVEKCTRIKADVVEKDERERDIRAILNYGHTLGHAIEAATDYKRYTHGEAIAIGMVGAARISTTLGLLGDEDFRRHISILKKAQLPVSCPSIEKGRILNALKLDKKRKENKLRVVLAVKIGKVKIEGNIPDKVIEEAVDYLRVHKPQV